MINEEKFRQLKRQAEEAQTARDKSSGQLEAAMKRLKDEFGCSSIKDAENKLKALTKEAEEAEEKYNNAVEAFEEKWDDRIDTEG